MMCRYRVSRNARLARLCARFGRARDGASAVEFAIVAVPFFMFVFMIIEVGLVFLGNFLLDSAAEESARLIRTGQAHASAANPAQFKEAICERLSGPFDCAANLKFEIKSYPDFSSVDMEPPLNGEDELRDDFGFDIGARSDVVVVRLFYEWDITAKLPDFGLDIGLGNMANGNRLIQSTMVFRNEPF